MTTEDIDNASSPEEARQLAIEWQAWQAEHSMYWSEAAAFMAALERAAKRWPELREEFKENGII